MTVGWQDVVAWTLVIAAAVYLVRKLWPRAARRAAGGCARGGCGACPAGTAGTGTGRETPVQLTTPGDLLNVNGRTGRPGRPGPA
jgi:hypothetical protein